MSDKYPRTPHFPFSPGIHDDDVIIGTFANLLHKPVVVTEKLDGGNCCLKDGLVFARTHSSAATHASFSMVKQLYNSSLVYQLPTPDMPPLCDSDPCFDNLNALEDLELYGENMMAIHSINYTPEDSKTKKAHAQLPGPFYLFGVFDRRTQSFWSWDAVLTFGMAMNLPTPPVLFSGVFNSEDEIRKFILDQMKSESEIGPRSPSCSSASSGPVPETVPAVPKEGMVVRTIAGYPRDKFPEHVAKYVRKGHIQTDENFKKHWKQASVASF